MDPFNPPQAADAAAPARRPIRSYVRREGRMTVGQQRALAQLWPRYGLDYTGARRDFNAVFGRQAPRVLEIGFGNGEALAWSAGQDAARDYLGIEVHRPGVGHVLGQLAAGDTSNVRLYCHDAVEVLRDEIGPAALAQVRIWFPDPWPKKRHHKRRMIQPDFVSMLAERVAPGGLLHLATDWAPYADYMLEAVAQVPAWRNCAGEGGFVPRPAWRIETRFEARGARLGQPARDLLFEHV